MPYTITLSDTVTNLVTVPDRTILGPLEVASPSQCSLNLVGRGASNYGLAYATNFVWLLQNFANITPPTQPISGQLWYNNTSGSSSLQLYNRSGQWVQVATSDAPFSLKGDLTVADGFGDFAILGANGTITLERPDYKPRITFEGSVSGVVNTANSVVLQLSTDKYGDPDLSISSAAFSGAGNIWHSKNLSPVDLGGNNIITGDNLFTGFNTFSNVTNFKEIIVSDTANATTATSLTDIIGGVVNLKSYNANQPSVKWWSNVVGNTHNVSMTFSDPNLLVNFNSVANTMTSRLILTTSTTQPVDGGTSHTVYHTGNLSPVVTNPAATQTIAAGLNLSGRVTANGITSTGMINGNNSGAFLGTLTLNGFNVLTGNTALAFVPLAGGTMTGALTVNSTVSVLNTVYLKDPTSGSPTGTGYISCQANTVYISPFANGSGQIYITPTTLVATGGNIDILTQNFTVGNVAYQRSSLNFLTNSGSLGGVIYYDQISRNMFFDTGSIAPYIDIAGSFQGLTGVNANYVKAGAGNVIIQNTQPGLFLNDASGTLKHYIQHGTDGALYFINGPWINGQHASLNAGNLAVTGTISGSSWAGNFAAGGSVTAAGVTSDVVAGRFLKSVMGARSPGADASVATLLGDFTFLQGVGGSFAEDLTGSTGYLVLPNGFIIQWGIAQIGNGADQLIGIPLNWPTGCIAVVCSFASEPAAGATCGANYNNVNSIKIGAAGLGGLADIFWIALGY